MESLNPLTYISWMSIVPFKFNLNAENRVYIPIYTFVIGISYYLLYLLWFLEHENWLDLIAISTIVGFAIIKRQQLVSIMQSIILVDEIFVRLGIKMNYNRIFRSVFFTSICMVIWDIINFLSIFIRNGPASLSLSYFISGLINFNVTLLVLKFFCLTHLVQNVFGKINEVSSF